MRMSQSVLPTEADIVRPGSPYAFAFRYYYFAPSARRLANGLP